MAELMYDSPGVVGLRGKQAKVKGGKVPMVVGMEHQCAVIESAFRKELWWRKMPPILPINRPFIFGVEKVELPQVFRDDCGDIRDGRSIEGALVHPLHILQK